MPQTRGGFWDKAQGHMGLATRQYTGQTPKQETEALAPGKTAGGAVSSAAGMGLTGYMAAGASQGGLTGPQGAAIGAAAGLISYLLS